MAKGTTIQSTTDAFGASVQVGDKVLFIYNVTHNPKLAKGTIQKIFAKKSQAYPDTLTIAMDDWQPVPHVYNNRICKLD